MTAATKTSHQGLLRTLFPNRDIFMGYEDSMVLREINKDTKFFGRQKETTVDYQPTSGSSSDFTKAQNNQGPSQRATFLIQHNTEYALFSITGTLLATSKDKGAIVDAYKVEMKRAGYSFGRGLAQMIWGNGGGSLGVISSGQTTATITLTTRADIVNFEVGMVLQASDDDGTPSSPAGLRNSGAEATVTAVDVENGQVTFGAALNTYIAAIDAGDYLFRSGDYGNKASGLLGWHPVTAPTSGDSHRNVDRSVAPERLSGTRYSGGSGGSKLEIFEDALAEAKLTGCKNLRRLYVNPLDYRDISKEMQDRQYIDIKTAKPQWGFSALAYMTLMGECGIIPELNVPKGYAWCLDPSNYTLRSAGECPRVLDFDGQSRLRHASKDEYEHRMGGYLDLDCENPGNALIITW